MSWRSGWYLDCAPKTYIAKSSGGAIPAGKYYWEVTIDAGGADGTGGYGILAGVANSSAILTGTVATAIGAAQPNSIGAAFFNSRANNPSSAANGWGYPDRAGSIPVEITGTTGTYGLLLDTINHKLWYRNITNDSPSGFWAGSPLSSSGDPTTNTLGADLAAMGVTGNLYVLVGASHGSASAKGQGTVNFGASAFAATPPTGSTSLQSAIGGSLVTLDPTNNSNLVLSNGNLTFAGTNVPVTFSPAISGFTTNVGFSNSVRSRFAIAQS